MNDRGSKAAAAASPRLLIEVRELPKIETSKHPSSFHEADPDIFRKPHNT
jgi:hypothetical protein